MWRYEFDAQGGHDCMSAAYLIYDKTNECRITIDTIDFASCNRTDLETQCRPLPEAEDMAKFIVASLNARDGA